MAMLKAQVDRTPAPQWVRVVGGFTAAQFNEKRLPTLQELNDIAPDTPVFLLHLYDRALLNRAALRACGYTKDTPDPPGGQIVRDSLGNPTGLLLAKPNALILYATLAKGPRLPIEYQANSTRHFMRELNRLGITSVIDAGGGFQNYPEDYQVIEQLHRDDQLTVRIAYNLFTQNKGKEVDDFRGWSEILQPRQGDDLLRHNGAGEMLVFSAADFELFNEPRPELPPELEPELHDVVKLLVEKRWPFRIHATYDESISRILDVYEQVNREVPFDGCTGSSTTPRPSPRATSSASGALGGGIAVQHRMAYQGEAFVERYGVKAARHTPPVKRMLAEGVPVGAGTDATAWPATTRGWRCPGWSPGAPWAAWPVRR
jgi:predicted amidohydrolase YtcJ